MAQNIFSQGMDAFDDSYARTGKVYSDIARRKAGSALAGGDRSGAEAALGGEGEIGAVRQLQDDQGHADETQYQHGKDQRSEALTAQNRNATILKEVATGLKTVPPGQRKAALQSVYPLFQQSGIDTSHFDPLTEDQLTDQQLDVFTGEVDKHHMVNLGGGGVGDFTDRGNFTTLREPDRKAPTGFEYDGEGNLAPIPGYIPGRKALAEATRAPPRARAPGRGGGKRAVHEYSDAELLAIAGGTR